MRVPRSIAAFLVLDEAGSTWRWTEIWACDGLENTALVVAEDSKGQGTVGMTH